MIMHAKVMIKTNFFINTVFLSKILLFRFIFMPFFNIKMSHKTDFVLTNNYLIYLTCYGVMP